MSNRASCSILDQFRTAPLHGPALLGVTLVTWVTGALYCSGYERLLSGLDNWPGSLIWSASAVLPWLTLFEWSKSRSGRRLTASIQSLAAALVVTGVLSLALGRFIDSADGHAVPLALSTLRRLPAAGIGLLLILWSRAGAGTSPSDCGDESSLASIAEAIDWVEAADNYVELHIGGRVAMRRMTLRNAERVLRKRGFIRVHRRFLVNGRKIAAIHGANGDMVVRLVDGTELPVGRAFSPNLATAA